MDEQKKLLDDRVILNVGGVKYETYRSTLLTYPKTLLGTMFNPRNHDLLKPVNGNEYFFDRNGYAFQYILEFYRTRRIHWPSAQEKQEKQEKQKESSNPFQVTNKQLEIELDYFQIESELYDELNLSDEMNIENVYEAAGRELKRFVIMLSLIICESIKKVNFTDISFYYYKDGTEPFIQSGKSPYMETELKKFRYNGYSILKNFNNEIKLYIEQKFHSLRFSIEPEYFESDGCKRWTRKAKISSFSDLRNEILNHSMFKDFITNGNG